MTYTPAMRVNLFTRGTLNNKEELNVAVGRKYK